MPNISMTEYSDEYAPKWKERFGKLDNSMKIRAIKKIRRILAGLPSEHARFGLPFFKENIDENHRICYKSFEDRKIRRFYFVGDHKEYERWLAGGGDVE
jgi:hypothetical protein